MKAYGRARQHPKGYENSRLKRGYKMWWQREGAQPEKGRARQESKRDTLKDFIESIGESEKLDQSHLLEFMEKMRDAKPEKPCIVAPLHHIQVGVRLGHVIEKDGQYFLGKRQIHVLEPIP